MSDIDFIFTELLRPRIGFKLSREELELIQKRACERGMTVEQYAYETVMSTVKGQKEETL